jgi:hypothetical protein
MLTRYLIVLIFLCSVKKAAAQHPPVFEGMTTDTTALLIGDLDLTLVKYSYNPSGINFLAIHDDEDTGVKAAFQYININGGTIVDCQYGSVRNFKFINAEEEFQTDPNSIYTPAGIKLGLKKYGLWDDNVIELLGATGKKILKAYSPEKTPYIFTLHNNADGGFGISSYLRGYDLETAADSVHINFQMDYDDLVLVTELPLYNLLKKENVNVVLQSQKVLDDGSLSVYAMQNKIPYINVEVQHGHIEEHLRLIEICTAVLGKCYPELGIKKPAE